MTLRIGVIGMSEGNGHPYSWSAIINGYDPTWMGRCPFPAIPAYLAEHDLAREGLSHLGRVTHVYAQTHEIATDVARASLIPNVVDEPEDMIRHVDAVLLARDDAENHLRFAEPFLRAGLPVYVDKPCAVRVQDFEALLALEQWPGQIFTCTPVRYSSELSVARAVAETGAVRRIEASAPKRWSTYAVHAIEPVVAALADRIPFARASMTVSGDPIARSLEVKLADGLELVFRTTGDVPSAVTVAVIGADGSRRELVVRDAFTAFRRALETFLRSASARAIPIPRRETRAIVELIESGL